MAGEGFLETVSPEWRSHKISHDLVLMGHSMGGITVLGAVARCSQAKAAIAFDPFWFSHMHD